MAEKKRLDVAVFELGLTDSRERAKAEIMAGHVFVNGQREDKAGTQVKADDKVELRGTSLRYVSRGGLKLEKAMQCFGVQLSGRVCMDIGASTGGFTDCMLQNGASKVYAVDVGYGQLAWKLRTDPRVVNMERTNIRHVTPETIGERVDFCSVDVSFISLTLVLPVVKALVGEGGETVCLIKPQFEAGKGMVGKKGVVRDSSVHCMVIEKVINFLTDNGFSVKGLDFSPVKGPEGNIEYLVYASVGGNQNEFTPQYIAELVERSHNELR
ncbi:MAG: TlyA family RNA methyltransferase [Ruminococcaceae bacterium]|nr:TlyA family RNA methyltransferase [Oscillospiraceae bacterium]